MRFKESIARKLEQASQQIQMLERMAAGNMNATSGDVESTVQRAKRLIEEASRLVYLEKE